MNKKETFSFPAAGIPSLLVIFAVLCLVVFSLLAVSTAQADRRLSRQSQTAIENYYRAELEANRILALLRSGETPPEVSREDDRYFFRCPISDTQALEAEVFLHGSEYNILRWQVVSAIDWQTDEKLPVWNGQGS